MDYFECLTRTHPVLMAIRENERPSRRSATMIAPFDGPLIQNPAYMLLT